VDGSDNLSAIVAADRAFLAVAELDREMISAHTADAPKRHISANAHFRIEPCATCPIAGYLIVSPRVHVSSLAELSTVAQEALGVTLAAATRAIESVVRPSRVYSALFAEESGSVHFHVFPRSDWLLAAYSRAHPEEPDISGPRLLDWARSTFHHAAPDYEEVTESISHILHQLI
jgi:diadenosine tetraphosphate (Ap4A) HIT family hydrolase